MAILKTGQAKYPFWGMSINYITGLDPLGLQTTSEATYSHLLPGISNLTNRMRYYGFYCWMLNLYASKRKQATKEDQFRFIRRSEFLASVIMATNSPGTPQITGSNFTKPLVLNTAGASISLADGADKEEGKATYWKYPSGAFGQYYLGPLMSLGWVVLVTSTEDVNEFIYKATPDREGVEISGHKMGEVFGKSVPKEAEDLFYQAVMSGSVSKKYIPFLFDFFYLDRVDTESEEWNCYRQALGGRDYPLIVDQENFKYHRSNTIRDILQFCSNENEGQWDWSSYLDHVYRLKTLSDEGVDETRTGWYHYQLNEYWHYAAGTIFWSMLVELQNRVHDQPLAGFTDEFTDISINVFQEAGGSASEEYSFRDMIEYLPNQEEWELVEEIAGRVKEGNHMKALGLGWLLLFTIMKNNESQLRDLDSFVKKRDISREGSVTEMFLAFFGKGDKPIRSFIHDYLLRYIINRHQYVAIRKMGNGTTCTFKFLVEERYIRFREVFAPRPTSPRLNALTNLLFDLGVIDEENTVTEIGKTF